MDRNGSTKKIIKMIFPTTLLCYVVDCIANIIKKNNVLKNDKNNEVKFIVYSSWMWISNNLKYNIGL